MSQLFLQDDGGKGSVVRSQAHREYAHGTDAEMET